MMPLFMNSHESKHNIVNPLNKTLSIIILLEEPFGCKMGDVEMWRCGERGNQNKRGICKGKVQTNHLGYYFRVPPYTTFSSIIMDISKLCT